MGVRVGKGEPMTLEEIRAIDSLKTWKELEEAREQIARLAQEKEEALAEVRIVEGKLGLERRFSEQLLERIKRMETAGDAMAEYIASGRDVENWIKAKETNR